MEGVSSNAEKVYNAMKNAGMIGEEKMGTAERITLMCKLPKNMVMNSLQELQNKNFVTRKVREKAAGYYVSQ
jgi:predicted transcriptional regulator